MENKETVIKITPDIESEFTDNRGNDEPKEGEDHE